MICRKCGNLNPENALVCESCGESLAVDQKPAKKENVITGFVGAFIGALIGGACIILLSQLGFIASASGFILAVCTLKGYELLGGGRSWKGIVISIIFMLVTPYLADRIDWAILVYQEVADYGIPFGEVFAKIPDLIAEGAIEMGLYVKNLLMIYGFALLGAFTTVKNTLKK